MTTLERQLLDLAARAEADPYFADVPVYVMRPRAQDGFAQIQTRIDQALAGHALKAGKAGVAVSFLMPTGDTQKPTVPGPQLTFVYTVRVQEIVEINFGPRGTRKSAEEVALQVLQLFHHCQLNGGNTLFADPSTLTPSAEFDPKITYDVRLSCLGGLARPAKVVAPLLSPASGAAPQTVAITCATPGAAIYFTTDGSYPSAANPAATLYSSPAEITTAATLRAAAQLTGYQQSDVAQASYS